MTAFKKFDPQAFIERERPVLDSAVTLAALATLAGPTRGSEICTTQGRCTSGLMARQQPKGSEIQKDHLIVGLGLDNLSKNQSPTPTPAKVAKVAKEGSRDRLEERAAILEFDESLSRAEAEALAGREVAADIYDNLQPEHDTATPYASALTALHPKCPAYVAQDRWRQAIADAAAFTAKWAAEAQAAGWTAVELFGLHPVPERPAANYSRLSRVDVTGLIWLLRGRPIVALTAAEAAYRCPNGAILTYRRETMPVSLSSTRSWAA